ncbi:MAG: HAD-IA family hydrolase [Gemmatimonadota bacterium]
MRFPTVLFDLDGTLVNSIELIVRSAEHAFQSRPGPRPSRSEIMAAIGRPLIAQFSEFASGEELDAYIAAYREYQLRHHDVLTTPYPGVSELLGDLRKRGCRLGVVTSKIERLANRALQHVGIDRHFELVVGIESTERHKPEPDPLLHALAALGARAGDAIYVGDSPFDIQAAQAAGVASVAVAWGAFDASTLRANGPDWLIEQPSDLLSIIEG